MGAGQGGDEGLDQPEGNGGLDCLLLVGGVQPDGESAVPRRSSKTPQARAIHRGGAWR